ncbi:MBL fold metallo-hydrolase [Paracoccus aestuariivivens]|uniref:MBL fold metallo-hydrolase n=1 Tax=Paracoccus aestuariivivens TaxID=1820333 RepID=A0A6L6JJH3_9RHOB|nr:MBL fold metallo-hydrolase [Paracoccus aestuariivivens]MTH79991.1 MBL fold metallo-hydrolase [Paracoccus aestuariivivens]
MPKKRIKAAFLSIAIGIGVPALGAENTEWITLGTVGGPPIHAEGAQIANALVVNGQTYLFDTGNDTLRQMAKAGLAVPSLRAVFLSHHHLDHVADLQPLMISHWLFDNEGKPLPVYGAKGTVDLVEKLLAASTEIERASFPVGGKPKPSMTRAAVASDIIPSETAIPVYEDENIKVSAVSVSHYQVSPVIDLDRMPEAVAFRAETKDRTYVFTGDTGASDNLANFVKGADVVISEIVSMDDIVPVLEKNLANAPTDLRQGIIDNIGKNHLDPEEIAQMLQDAGASKLVLTHFVPGAFQVQDLDGLIDKIRQGFDGEIVVAEDLGRY